MRKFSPLLTRNFITARFIFCLIGQQSLFRNLKIHGRSRKRRWQKVDSTGQISYEKQFMTYPSAEYCPQYDPEGYSRIKAFVYNSVPLNGTVTKVFAFIGAPERCRFPAPAVILVHGGGCHPDCEWMNRWIDRGYIALAMDTTGFFPAKENNSSGQRKFLASYTGITPQFSFFIPFFFFMLLFCGRLQICRNGDRIFRYGKTGQIITDIWRKRPNRFRTWKHTQPPYRTETSLFPAEADIS